VRHHTATPQGRKISIRSGGQSHHTAVKRRRAGLAVRPDPAHSGRMAKTKSPRVTFKMQRITQDDWQIEAHCPGTDVRHIKGFKSKSEIDEWLNGSRRIDWLRSQGYAK
jgi:hypothetical protein